MEDFELVASRLKAARLVVFSLLLVGVAAWLLTLPDASLKIRVVGWVGIPFFTLGAIVAAAQVFRPAVLRLDREGFVLSTLFRPSVRTAWADIEPVFIARVRRAELLAFRYTPGRRPARLMDRLNAHIGADGVMPNTFPMSPRDLARVMNDFRDQALGAPKDLEHPRALTRAAMAPAPSRT